MLHSFDRPGIPNLLRNLSFQVRLWVWYYENTKNGDLENLELELKQWKMKNI